MPHQRTVHYTIKQILAWADKYHEFTGRWPTSRTGEIWGTPHTWEGVNSALAKGICGLPGGDSLARLLRRKRGIADQRAKMPDLTMEQILQWLDDHHAKFGNWPRRDAGPVCSRPSISWSTVDRLLRRGGAHLPGGSCLRDVLRDERDVWDARGSRTLSIELVLKWAEDHRLRTGRWPVTLSGPVIGRPGEVWANIDVAIRNARRGFKKKSSLSRILTDHFGARYTDEIGRPLDEPPLPMVKGTRVRVIGRKQR